MSDLRVKALMNHYRKSKKEPYEHMSFLMSDDPGVWYALLYGMVGSDKEFDGGEYLVRFEAPANYPHGPPKFNVLTPNGLYAINQTVCVSIGMFHASQYRAVLGICGFAQNLVSGLIGWREMTSGIGILSTTSAEKKAFAEQSRAYNDAHHGSIVGQLRVSAAKTE